MPQLSQDPLGAIGFLLQQFGAGVTGQELPATRLRREALQRQQLEMQQLAIGSRVVRQGLELLERAPAEERQKVIESFTSEFSESLPGLKETLTELSENIPDAKSVASAVGEFGPQLYAMCGSDLTCIRQFAADEGFMKSLQRQRDRTNMPVVGAKLRHITNTMFDHAESLDLPRDADGDFILDAGDLMRLNQSLPDALRLSDSEMGTLERNPNVMLRYGIKTPDMMEFEAKEEFKSRLRIRERAISGEGLPKSDLLDDRGNVKNEVSNDIFRRTATLLGVQVDPRTGLMTNLTPETARQAQELSLTAASLLQSGRARGIDEAVSMATSTSSGREAEGLPPVEKPAVPLSDDKRQLLLDQNAEIERIVPMVESRFEAALGTGFWSNIQAGVNVLAGVVGTEAFPDNSANRQKLREMNNEIKRAFANNPRFPVAEQNRILEMVPTPDDIFQNPATAERNMRSLVRTLREMESSNSALLEGRQPETPPPATSEVSRVGTREEYDALPSGALYDVGDGVIRRKK